jgi:hypothetical protein
MRQGAAPADLVWIGEIRGASRVGGGWFLWEIGCSGLTQPPENCARQGNLIAAAWEVR